MSPGKQPPESRAQLKKTGPCSAKEYRCFDHQAFAREAVKRRSVEARVVGYRERCKPVDKLV